MDMLLIVIVLLVGILSGATLVCSFTVFHCDGILHVRHKDEDTDAYSLDFMTGLDDIPKKKIVILRVMKTE